jgi:glycine/D-amino acid oxidase-like deaminating enzyme
VTDRPRRSSSARRARIETPAYGHELRNPAQLVEEALQDAKPEPFWLDDPARPEPRPRLDETITTDLVVVGGGFCGLWTAIIAKQRQPKGDVILIEADRIGWAASGRNGGFVEASLTHGPDNGALHFPDELSILDRLADENFAAFRETVATYDLDAEWEETGVLTVATEPHQVDDLRDAAGKDSEFVTDAALRELGDSPLYRAGLFDTHGVAYVHPAKLAWELARLAEELGVRIFENTRATNLTARDNGVTVRTEGATVDATHVALATNAFPSLIPGLGLFTVPIYDYVLMTEPLTKAQLRAIGWTGRHGITDSSREFHYYRKTKDDRILFGGFDAVYHRGRKIRPEHDQRPETFRRLADHFFSTFPQLAGIRFTHTWGGVIDMSTQLVAFHGTAKRGRVAYSAGYTGLGVAATRFGAEVMLDLLEGRATDRTRLKMSRRLPIPIPPEPFAYPLIQLMRRAVQKSDRNGGRDGILLKLAGLFGVGFDS